jgi:hypothetical protein
MSTTTKSKEGLGDSIDPAVLSRMAWLQERHPESFDEILKSWGYGVPSREERRA